MQETKRERALRTWKDPVIRKRRVDALRAAIFRQTEVTCDQCGKVFISIPSWINRSKHHFCSRRCSSLSQVGRTCKPVSSETRAMIAAKSRGRKHTAESIILMSQTKKGHPPYFLGHKHTEESKRKMSEARKGCRMPMDVRAKCGASIRRAWTNPLKYQHYNTERGKFYSNKMIDNIPHRSSFELAYIRMLELDSSVGNYWYEPCRVPYMWDGQAAITIPDFLVEFVDGRKQLTEVKPLALVTDPKVAAKLRAMESFAGLHGWGFRVISEPDLNIRIRTSGGGVYAKRAS